MMQSVRERTPELAVLKTLGFSDGKVLTLVLDRSACRCAVFAAAIGLALATFTVRVRRAAPDLSAISACR